MTITTVGAMVPYTDLRIRTFADIDKATGSEETQEVLAAYGAEYSQINASQALVQLGGVGDFLSVAYAGTKGTPSARLVTGIFCDYQTIVTDSSILTSKFVYSSIQALQCHASAIEFSRDIGSGNNREMCRAMMQKCGKIAKLMADQSNVLVQQSKALCDQSKDALLSVQTKQSDVSGTRQGLDAEIAKAIEKHTVLEKRVSVLNGQLDKLQGELKDAESQASTEHNKALLLGIATAFVKPIGNLIGKPIEAFRSLAQAISSQLPDGSAALSMTDLTEQLAVAEVEYQQAMKKNDEVTAALLEVKIAKVKALKEQAMTEAAERNRALETIAGRAESAAERYYRIADAVRLKKAELQDEQMCAEMDLAETVAKLQTHHENKNHLGTSIASLEMSLQTLRKIKSVFERCRQFWTLMSDSCNTLADTNTVEGLTAGENPKLNVELGESAWKWLALAKIVLASHRIIQTIDEKVTVAFIGLASEDEVDQVIQGATALLAPSTQPLLTDGQVKSA